MSTANERQHGGDHYQKREYQHWDFACDTGQHYLIGCATKYASRWQDKGGIQDLEKMVHYLDKAEERGVCQPPAFHRRQVEQYVQQLGSIEGTLVTDIMYGRWGNVRAFVRDIINEKRAADAT